MFTSQIADDDDDEEQMMALSWAGAQLSVKTNRAIRAISGGGRQDGSRSLVCGDVRLQSAKGLTT